MFARLTARDEWKYMLLLPRASAVLTFVWWFLLIARGLLPALFVVAMGVLVGAVQKGDNLLVPLALVGGMFVLVQVLSPLHLMVSQNLGSKMAAHLYDRLTVACTEPQGMAHLENPEMNNDLAMARDFDLGISGPPLFVSMDFIAAGLVEMVAGLVATSLLFGYAWWAPILIGGAWLMTHYLLRESGVWRDRQTNEVRMAQRHADYAYQMAVNPPASKELRLFSLADWVVNRFATHRRKLHDLRWEATRLRQRPLALSLVSVTIANVIVFVSLGYDATQGNLELRELVIFAAAAMTASMIAFGGLSWALDGAAAPAGAVLRLQPAMAEAGHLQNGSNAADNLPAKAIDFKNLKFAYPTTGEVTLENFNLHIPAGTTLAIVGPNGAGKTTLAKLLCRLYDPQEGSIEIDGIDLRDLSIDSWRNRVTAVFQDFVRFELSLRENVCPTGEASDEQILRALDKAGMADLVSLDTILNKAYAGGTDFSGGQWQRIALARALCQVYLGAGLVLLDEPTAQLDVRGEAEIFNRVIEETKDVTTILISHRFSTVRKTDLICVLEHGRVIELGSHDELMALGGRYQTMFDLQASHFEENETELDVLN
ncbi:MAG: ABC transporter ATP-binding protein [Gammaproteobacteria bacterium]|nr:ABC transporter ATP-binding protein [Gammaproteobacteria bacterium]